MTFQTLDNELSFLRLLDRCKKLSRNAMSSHRHQLQCSISVLECLFIQLQDKQGLDHDILMQYGRELHKLKAFIAVEQKPTTEERLEAISAIPCEFPSDSVLRQRQRTHDNGDIDEEQVTSLQIKASNAAIYKADIRRQLLSGTKDFSSDAHDTLDDVQFLENQQQQHTELAEELLKLTVALKKNAQVAGDVIKEDNVTIAKMQQLSHKNQEDLTREGHRLEQHAARSWGDCFVLITILVVVWVFLLCVLVMKFFRKRI